MMYYLDQYRGGAISVEALVMALFELLNTHAKVTCSFCPYLLPRSSAQLNPKQPHPPISQTSGVRDIEWLFSQNILHKQGPG